MRISSKYGSNRRKNRMAETSYEYITNEPHALISTGESKIIRHVLRLADEHPADVDIRFLPENNGGVLVAKVPRTWIKKPSPPRVVSDEQRKRMSEAFKNRFGNQSQFRENRARIDEDGEDE